MQNGTFDCMFFFSKCAGCRNSNSFKCNFVGMVSVYFLMGKIGLHGRIKEVEGIYNPKCNIVFTAVLSQISFPLTNTRFG